MIASRSNQAGLSRWSPLSRMSFASRLVLVLALLLLAYASLVAVLSRQTAQAQAQETLQRLSHGLAAHIVGHWPEITKPQPDATDLAARQALLQMLMVVNPASRSTPWVLRATCRPTSGRPAWCASTRWT